MTKRKLLRMKSWLGGGLVTQYVTRDACLAFGVAAAMVPHAANGERLLAPKACKGTAILWWAGHSFLDFHFD